MNDLCYNYERIKNDNPIFPFIDWAYVIIMDNSKYENRVREQLNKYPLCKNTYLQWNQGFKNCRKNLAKQISVTDLTDSFKTVLKNALDNNHNYILILEEDFIINQKIKNNEVRNDISNFVYEYNPDIILLGSLLWSVDNCPDINFKKALIKTGTHAMIFNRKAIKKYYEKISSMDNEIIDIDVITNNVENMYSYKIPLIIQIYQVTDNQKNWGSHIKNEFKKKILVGILVYFIRFLGFSSSKTILNAYNDNYEFNFNDNYKLLKKLINFLGNSFINLVTI